MIFCINNLQFRKLLYLAIVTSLALTALLGCNGEGEQKRKARAPIGWETTIPETMDKLFPDRWFCLPGEPRILGLSNLSSSEMQYAFPDGLALGPKDAKKSLERLNMTMSFDFPLKACPKKQRKALNEWMEIHSTTRDPLTTSYNEVLGLRKWRCDEKDKSVVITEKRWNGFDVHYPMVQVETKENRRYFVGDRLPANSQGPYKIWSVGKIDCPLDCSGTVDQLLEKPSQNNCITEEGFPIEISLNNSLPNAYSLYVVETKKSSKGRQYWYKGRLLPTNSRSSFSGEVRHLGGTVGKPREFWFVAVNEEGKGIIEDARDEGHRTTHYPNINGIDVHLAKCASFIVTRGPCE